MTLPHDALAVAADLDELVVEVCRTLQITESQFKDAEGHYLAVGRWLRAPDSPLARLRPLIYPQGSMALLTTVKPRDHEEYDLDLVLRVEPISEDPMWLYGKVRDRLAAHTDYGAKLEPLRRCLRLNYAKQFHLDILPARPDELQGGTCIEVPDRKLEDWKESNPIGFRKWFEARTRGVVTEAVRSQVPLPSEPILQLEAVLRRVVQLIKRRRDNTFAGSDDAPRSVVLTTLAGHAYEGQDSIILALRHVLHQIEQAIAAAAPGRIVVLNPSNPAERFCEAWNDVSYQAFGRFIREFRQGVDELLATRGFDAIGAKLDLLFGGELGAQAVRAYAERRREAMKAGQLRASPTTGLVLEGTGIRSPRHTFHGS